MARPDTRTVILDPRALAERNLTVARVRAAIRQRNIDVSGGEIESGPIFSNEIRWVRKLGKGDVSVAEFRQAVMGELPDTFVVDARTKDEVAELEAALGGLADDEDQVDDLEDALSGLDEEEEPEERSSKDHTSTAATAAGVESHCASSSSPSSASKKIKSLKGLTMVPGPANPKSPPF